MTSSNPSPFTFLEAEKHLARQRIRQCQIFLSSPAPLSDSDTEDAELRQCLETVRRNAEEDYGTFLHLLTILKGAGKKEHAAAASGADGKSPASSAPKPSERRSTEQVDGEEDMDPFADERKRDHDKELGDEHDEEKDQVPNLVTETIGRFSQTRQVVAPKHPLSSSDTRNLARSLPVRVPPPPGTEHSPGDGDSPRPAEDLLESDDIPATHDILASMQTIARSLHTGDAFGDMPHSLKRSHQPVD